MLKIKVITSWAAGLRGSAPEEGFSNFMKFYATRHASDGEIYYWPEEEKLISDWYN